MSINRLRYGNYTFQADCVMPSVATTRTLNENGVPIEEQVTWTCAGEFIVDGGSTAIAIERQRMRNALRIPFQNLFYLSDTNVILDSLTNAGASKGVVVIEGPDFGVQVPGFEFVSGFTFMFRAQASYPLVIGPPGGIQIITWSETLDRSGGGPKLAHVEYMEEPPEKIQLKKFTVYRATQQGTASSLLGYPTPPPPIWPQALIDNPQISDIAPDQSGRVWGRRWVYNFESAGPLLGSLPRRG